MALNGVKYCYVACSQYLKLIVLSNKIKSCFILVYDYMAYCIIDTNSVLKTHNYNELTLIAYIFQ